MKKYKYLVEMDLPDEQWGGYVDSRYLATEEDVKEIKELEGEELYFGEYFGKHSEVYGTLKKESIKITKLEEGLAEEMFKLLGEHISGADVRTAIGDYLIDKEYEERKKKETKEPEYNQELEAVRSKLNRLKGDKESIEQEINEDLKDEGYTEEGIGRAIEELRKVKGFGIENTEGTKLAMGEAYNYAIDIFKFEGDLLESQIETSQELREGKGYKINMTSEDIKYAVEHIKEASKTTDDTSIWVYGW